MMHDRGTEAVHLLDQMESEFGDGDQVVLNAATFVAVLSGCGHSGLVAEGIQQSSQRRFRISNKRHAVSFQS